jgi:hypothetical protein
MTKLHVAVSPCTSCPYRRDTPPGVWHPEEYNKLRAFDDNGAFGAFLCHHSTIVERDTVCRGWLTVHSESVAARLMILRGQITEEQRYAEVAEPLYTTGSEAADAGLAGVEKLTRSAKKVIQRLHKLKTKKRKKKRGPDH